MPLSVGCWILDVGCFSFQQISAFQRRQKILFHARKFLSSDGIARDQNQLDWLCKFMLMLPETFAEQSPRAAALNCAADFFACDDAEFWRRAIWQFVPVGNQAALREPFALLPDARKIATLCEPRGATQSQEFRRFGGHARKSDRRQAFATHAAAVGQRGFAAFARIAVKKSVLPFAADF